MENQIQNEWSTELFTADESSRFESEELAGIVVSQMAQSCCCGGSRGGSTGGGTN